MAAPKHVLNRYFSSKNDYFPLVIGFSVLCFVHFFFFFFPLLFGFRVNLYSSELTYCDRSAVTNDLHTFFFYGVESLFSSFVICSSLMILFIPFSMLLRDTYYKEAFGCPALLVQMNSVLPYIHTYTCIP